MMYQPSHLHAFLNSLGITAKKGLSQNFLIDGNIISKIVAAASVTSEDLVLEIGPGPGALTEALLATGARVMAVEMDEVLATSLRQRLGDSGRLEVFAEDFLEFDLDKELSTRLVPHQKAKVIANLPYHITTPILTRLIDQHEKLSSLTVMVQREVAERMTAPPGGHTYGSLTVFLNFYTTVKTDFIVSHNCFYPKPDVDSAVVTLTLHAPTAVSDRTQFFKMTRTAFEHRRKMLRASLKDLYRSENVTKALTDLGLNPLARPEELSLESFVKLFEQLSEAE